MNNIPLVSVVIPVYNAENTIAETIESVIKQTFTDFELVIINDGSTDNSSGILYSFTDKRIRIIDIENSGASSARNLGIDNTCGKYISFIDSDDLWEESKIEKQLNALQINKDCEVVYSWTMYIDENGDKLHPIKPVDFTGDVYKKMLINNFIGSGSNILAKRDAVISAGKFDSELTYAEEWDLFIRLSINHNFAVIKEYLVYYRQSASSQSSSIEDFEKGTLEVIDRAYKQASQQYKYLKPKAISSLYSYTSYLYLTRQNLKDWKKKSIINIIKSIKAYPIVIITSYEIIKFIFLIIYFIIPSNYSYIILKLLLRTIGFYRTKILQNSKLL